jgi:hypothetical protein
MSNKAKTTEEIIQRSDKKILEAKQALGFSDRGISTMKALKGVFSYAQGLDSVGGAALLTLVSEFVKNHRRGFLE